MYLNPLLKKLLPENISHAMYRTISDSCTLYVWTSHCEAYSFSNIQIFRWIIHAGGHKSTHTHTQKCWKRGSNEFSFAHLIALLLKINSNENYAFRGERQKYSSPHFICKWWQRCIAKKWHMLTPYGFKSFDFLWSIYACNRHGESSSFLTYQ